MPLEHWDERRKRWIMYRSEGDHRDDCDRHPFKEIPGRVFLDTTVVNLIVKFAPSIFEMEAPDPSTPADRALDVEALLHVFAVGAHADWTLRASSKTLEEVNRTACDDTRSDLASYALGLIEFDTEESRYGDDLGRRIADSSLLAALPGRADRELVGNAIGLGCDAFVTADYKTIINRRERLPKLPLRILTPREWWAHIKPWGGLWL